MANERESIEDVAGHIVDALTKAGLLRPDEYEQATGIVIDELDAGIAEREE